MDFDWISTHTEILLNPRMQKEDMETIRTALGGVLYSHVWLVSSGSTGSAKCVALSKEAILTSAAAVNVHLESTDKDIWINPLPTFHVGGLGVEARAYLSESSVINVREDKWDAASFYRQAEESGATLSALVPAHVYDFVMLKMEAPPSLRAIVVGGGKLSPELYREARLLGWPLLPSYGLTEAASQVATAPLKSLESYVYPRLTTLSHVKVNIEENSYISIQGKSLLTAYATIEKGIPQLVDPKQAGWFLTEDKGTLTGPLLEIIGRSADLVKIGGESVDMNKLEQLLDKLRLEAQERTELALVAITDPRLETVIHLAINGPKTEAIDAIVNEFQGKVMPYERIREVHEDQDLPRSALKKLLKYQLEATIKKKNET